VQLRDIIPELTFGSLVVAVAIGMAVHQWRMWKRDREDLAGEPAEEAFAWSRLRRRLQVSVLLAVIGVMLPIGVWKPLFQKRLLLFLGYWLAVLLLIFWVVLLALGDLLATAMHSRVVNSRLHRERRMLEEELERFRQERTDDSSIE
jgi:hypothetical protein